MNYFLNYRNKELTVDKYRIANAACTDLADVINAKKNDTDETLTTSIEPDEALFLKLLMPN